MSSGKSPTAGETLKRLREDAVRAHQEKHRAKDLAQVSFWLDSEAETLLKHITETRRLQSGEAVKLALVFWHEHHGRAAKTDFIAQEVAAPSSLGAWSAQLAALVYGREEARLAQLEALIHGGEGSASPSSPDAWPTQLNALIYGREEAQLARLEALIRGGNDAKTITPKSTPPPAQKAVATQCLIMEQNPGMGFGPRLKAARELAGLIQGNLAKLSGVAKSAISAFESGKREPSAEVRTKLTAVLPMLAKWEGIT